MKRKTIITIIIAEGVVLTILLYYLFYQGLLYLIKYHYAPNDGRDYVELINNYAVAWFNDDAIISKVEYDEKNHLIIKDVVSPIVTFYCICNDYIFAKRIDSRRTFGMGQNHRKELFSLPCDYYSIINTKLDIVYEELDSVGFEKTITKLIPGFDIDDIEWISTEQIPDDAKREPAYTWAELYGD